MRNVCWAIAIVLALGACGSRAPANTGAGELDDEPWVCRPDGGAWDCDQGEEPPAPAAPEGA